MLKGLINNMIEFEEWLETRQTIYSPVEINLAQFEDKVIEAKSSIKKDMLQLDSNNELLVAAHIDEAIQSALDRVEHNLEMLRSLTKMPRSPTFVRAIAKRSKLGRKLLRMVTSQTILRLDRPLYRKQVKVINGKLVQTAETQTINVNKGWKFIQK